MRTELTSTSRLNIRSFAMVMALILTVTSFSAIAQNPPLSFADLVIGLRSKKLTLEERNQILAAAVKERGITFAITPEIEKELTATGADANLITAIKAKSQPVKPAVVATPTPAPKPAATPPPPDAAFYQKRADASLEKGEVDAALTDLNKAVEMKADDANLYVSRGRALASKKSYDLSVKDFDTAIELSPKTAIAFLNRGETYEKMGEVQKALADYRKASDLEPTNEAAKAEAKRLQDQLDKEEAAKAAAAKPVVVARPEFVNVGSINPTTAVRLITPTYSAMARQSRAEGKVTVDVELDAEGNVTYAKASAGPALLRQSAEDAAKRSKFKPVLFNGEPIKAKGQVTYSFTL